MLELPELAALTELSAAIEPLLRVREDMRTERKALDRTLAAAAWRSDVGLRLMTIPGVGPVTTLAYIAAIDDPGPAPRKLSARISALPRACISRARSTDRGKSASAAIECCGTTSMRVHRR